MLHALFDGAFAPFLMLLRHQWKIIRAAYGSDRQVHIQKWPIEMVSSWPLHGRQLLNGCLFEPRKFFKWQKQLFIDKQQPKTILGHMRDLSRRSDRSMHLEFLSGECQISPFVTAALAASGESGCTANSAPQNTRYAAKVCPPHPDPSDQSTWMQFPTSISTYRETD